MIRMLLLVISSLSFSCGEFNSHLPLPTNSGIAFAASRDTVIQIDTVTTVNEVDVHDEECLNLEWSTDENKEQ